MAQCGGKPPLSARDRAWHAVALGAVAFSIVCIVSGYRHVGQTFDEANHLATGMEWLERGEYRWWTETPPVGRVSAAIVPYLAGAKLPDPAANPFRVDQVGFTWFAGNEVLHAGGHYSRMLVLARLGSIAWLMVMFATVWSWSRWAAGPFAAALAVAMLCSLPPLLAHAGLATTDVPFASAFVVASYAVTRCVAEPAWSKCAWAGAAGGLAVATKFTALLFLPVFAVTAIALKPVLQQKPQHDRMHVSPWIAAATVVLVGALTVWGTYRFSIGPLQSLPPRIANFQVYQGVEAGQVSSNSWLLETQLPAPELFHGVLFARTHGMIGHRAYLNGRTSDHGFWDFYLSALALKTPVAFWLFVAAGLVGLWTMGRAATSSWSWLPLAAVPPLLASLTTSTLNLGVRHVLVVYPLLAIGAAAGVGRVAEVMSVRAQRAVACGALALVVVQAGVAVAQWPDYLVYFNRLAGRDPGALLNDSDLDWGQGVKGLEVLTQEYAIDRLAIAYFGTANLCRMNLPELEPLPPGRPVAGWVAISDKYYRGLEGVVPADPCAPFGTPGLAVAPDSYSWLERYQPVVWAGQSIRLYRIEQ